MNLRIRPETPADYPAIRDVLLQAFGQPAEADLVEALRRDDAYRPELALVAECDGALVGHVLFTRAWVEAAGRSVEVAALAPVAVAPEWQKRGVGGALIREGLARAAAAGFPGAIVLGHAEYYPRFGFVPARRFGVRCPFPVPDEIFMALPLRDGGLDGVQGMVRYAPPFYELEG